MAASVEEFPDPAALPDEAPGYAGNMEVFLNYLRKAGALTLGTSGSADVLSSAIFTDKPSEDAVRKFLSDPQTRVLLAQKIQRKGEKKPLLF